MSSWRDKILSEFTPQVSRLTLVADPDGLLLEEGVLGGIRERGFELIPFEDHVAFRYAYETGFRSRWDRGEDNDLVVALRSPLSSLEKLPYDLLQAGRQLSFNLGDLFPHLSYPVVAALDRADLDAVYAAQASYAPGRLGDNATKDFILWHVFDIALEMIRQPPDLLRVLLRRHYRGRRVPKILDERLIQMFRLNGLFEDWPLESIIPDREAFFAFLQERWPLFLDRIAAQSGGVVRETPPAYGLRFPGPADLPFEHDDVRVYVDDLFLDGLLHPVPHRCSDVLSRSWVSLGVVIQESENLVRRLGGLLDSIQRTIPVEGARYVEWLQFAYRWGELIALVMESDEGLPDEYLERMEALKSAVDAAIVAWTVERYAGLINLPPTPPVMLHHIPRFMSRGLADDRRAKAALILIDGCSLDQWITVRGVIEAQDAGLRFHENAVFAWIPTITSVSRQAAFAGKPPLYFPSSIHTTDREPDFWSQFWVDQGLRKHEVGYVRILGDDTLEKTSALVTQPGLRVMGVVIDQIDKIMHGMQLGLAGMHNQVRQWAGDGLLRDLLGLLLDGGFVVYLAADHGGVEATGCGRPSEGAIAELRGQRVRLYSDALLRGLVKARFPGTLEWPPIGLPEDCLALLAPSRKAFVGESERIVTHGGISVEELIVPFVRIDREEIA